MPRITEELRKQWQEHQRHNTEFRDRIEAKYGKKHKRHAECRLCGNMVTAQQPEDVFDALSIHEQSHPEYAEWIALSREFSIMDLPKLFHDHDCVFVRCACQCGCDTKTCVADLLPEIQNKPELCALCQLYQGRGHIEHRLPGE